MFGMSSIKFSSGDQAIEYGFKLVQTDEGDKYRKRGPDGWVYAVIVRPKAKPREAMFVQEGSK